MRVIFSNPLMLYLYLGPLVLYLGLLVIYLRPAG